MMFIQNKVSKDFVETSSLLFKRYNCFIVVYFRTQLDNNNIERFKITCNLDRVLLSGR